MREPTKDVQLAIARAILEEWTQRACSWRLRGQVAVEVGDKTRIAETQAELENALKTIEALEKHVAELEKEAAAQQQIIRVPTGSSNPS